MPKKISIQKARERKLTRYFTGKKCPKGHIAERLVSSRACYICLRKKSNLWAEKNREKLNARRRELYPDIKDELNRKSREKRAKKRKKKKISKFKKCTACKKKLKKTYKNFRYISKKRNILRFRPICRPCERKLLSIEAKTPRGKERKQDRDKRYALGGKKKLAQKRYYDKNQPKLMKIAVAKRAVQRKTIPHVKIRDNLALRMRLALKEQNLTKRNTTAELVGCSIKYLKQYLEIKFKPGMTWKNHGRFGWHIDHIRACSRFDLSDLSQQKKCFNYTNLQPLWAKDNIRKSNK